MEQSIAEREFVGNTLFAAVDRLAERRGDELEAVVESGRPLRLLPSSLFAYAELQE